MTRSPTRPAPTDLRVSVRELRLMTGRVLLTTAIPFGTVAATRDIVVGAETHGLDGLAGLLDALPALRARHLRPELRGATALFPAPESQPALATAADLLDLAVAGAHADGSASFAAPGDDWAVRALPPRARRHGVELTLTRTTVTAEASADGPRPGPDAAELRALTYGVAVPTALWRRVVAEAETALTPDSALSRTHAGDSVFGPDGEILAEVGEDEPVEAEPVEAEPVEGEDEPVEVAP
ncbi:hypothetical protein [Streptomyces sp. NRRL S-1868]|uniref:hypothetical protein n=1 Tax=Streptomyces sp. NRRL S-1868 TaxID=1463892 RepID=UPI0004C7FBD7|nr:hypothetical protein [Streptomyces sp. NRRL S-1868]